MTTQPSALALWRKLWGRFPPAFGVLHRRASYRTAGRVVRRRRNAAQHASLQAGPREVLHSHSRNARCSSADAEIALKERRGEAPFQLAFFTRMLFSCLIDADRTRTEEFCDPEKASIRSGLSAEHGRPSLTALKSQLDASLRMKQDEAEPSKVNRQRAMVLGHCRDAVLQSPGFSRSMFRLAAARPYRRWPLRLVTR